MNARRAEALALPTSAEVDLPSADLATRLNDFAENRHAVFAADLVSAALPAGAVAEAREAAEFLLASPQASSLARRVAERLLSVPNVSQSGAALGSEDADAAAAHIHALRRRLADEPGNVLVWAEQARLYAIRGDSAQAQRSMGIALSLAPNDRYLLRSSTRLWVHYGDPERAHRLLTRSPRTANDPWLIAAEIGVADLAARTSRLLRPGRVMLDRVAPVHATELASSLATAELAAGQSKRARRLFEISLVDPNDNALAQAEWASDQLRLPGLAEKLETVPSSYEAHALDAAAAGRSEEAVQHAFRWLADEPYSMAAARFGSYQASKLRDFANGAEFAARGLVANRDDSTLWNNLAFCYAKMDRVDDADRALGRIEAAELADPQEVTLKATRGLIAFRRGDRDEGARLYLEAIAAATNPTTKAIALIMFASEALRSDPDEGSDVAREAAAQVAKGADREARGWLRHLRP